MLSTGAPEPAPGLGLGGAGPPRGAGLGLGGAGPPQGAGLARAPPVQGFRVCGLPRPVGLVCSELRLKDDFRH